MNLRSCAGPFRIEDPTMCGISGIYRHHNQKPVEPEEIKSLNSMVQHRGPDSDGIWMDPSKMLAFGHQRLSILDLSSSGHQPMLSRDGNWVVVLNGEIFNFLEIQEELKRKGYVFASETDTEVALYAFMEWGKQAFNRFNGMWAMAVYNSVSKKLILARDRYGIKPVYYYHGAEELAFSSEIKALDSFYQHTFAPNKNVIQSILTGSGYYHGTTQTYIEGIQSVPGGHLLEIDENGINLARYYQLKMIDTPTSFAEQSDMLRYLLTDSIKLRLRSDVPVATCLSGGLDSGSIASLIGEMKDMDTGRFSHFSHKAFIASFPGTPIDETSMARMLATKNGLDLEVLEIMPPTGDELEKEMLLSDGPMHALAFYPIQQLYGFIRKQGIIVTLDGQGPDEMLGGYNPVFSALSAAWEQRNFSWFFDVYNTYKSQGENSQFSAKRYTKMELKRFLKLQWAMAQQTYRKPLKDMLSKINLYTYPSTIKTPELLPPARQQPGLPTTFDQRMFTEFFQNPLPGILNQYDRASMAHGVECRMPFMDYRIVEFVFSLPYHSKVGKGYTKRVLREAMKGILPDETRLNKTKIGFNAPIVDWYKGPLKTWVEDQVTSVHFIRNPYFDGKETSENTLAFIRGENQSWADAWQIWPKIHLAWWMNKTNRL